MLPVKQRRTSPPMALIEYEDGGTTGQLKLSWQQMIALNGQLDQLVQEGIRWVESRSGKTPALPGEQALIEPDGVTLTIEPESSPPSETPEPLSSPQQVFVGRAEVPERRPLVDALGCVGFAALPVAERPWAVPQS